MTPKTEEFLYYLLWTADQLMRPSFRNIHESFESWAYRNGMLKRIWRLERQKFIERKANASHDRLYRLTAQGRLHVLGGRDPEQQWARHWDGKWRIVLFDVPTRQNREREWLRRYLRQKSFGYLQNSVWITPDPLENEYQIVGKGKINVESLVLLEARPCGGESDSEIVAGAWDFARINRHYAQHLKLLDQRPDGALLDEVTAKQFQRWAKAEREGWLNAIAIDPLLPAQILPKDYVGRQAWRRRAKVLRQASRQLHAFHPG